MTKDAVLMFRAPEILKDQIDAAAERRGMNRSDFIRYVLTSFFDASVVHKPHNAASDTPEVPA